MCLTAFQTTCELQLLSVLEELNWEVIERQVEGIHEMYIRIRIVHPAVNLYVYDDEAGIQGDDVSIQFEKPEYRTPDDLIAGFLRSIRELDTN
jgi:hypothetical protein